MRLIALAESVDHVCSRYRLAAFRNHFTHASHSLEIRPLPTGLIGRLALGRDLGNADAVIVQRKLLPRVTTALLRRRVRRLIFDFDDAVWLRDSYSAKGLNDPRRARRFRALVRASDLVISGNAFLADEARRWTDPGRVIVIPTCVEPHHYPVREHTTGSGLRLVWVGSSSTLRGLEHITPILSAIGESIPGTRLKLICDRFITIPHLPVEQCRWDEATERFEIASADVGISWVPDDPWSHGKCGLKLLQYQAAGLPSITNAVGVHREIVRNGETGFLANSTEEWVAAVRRLATNPQLRLRLGTAARRQVEERYSVMTGAGIWLKGLERFDTGSELRKTG